MNQKSTCQAGFTLIELLVCLAITALLTALTPPLMSSMLGGAQLRTASREIAEALRDAREQAVQRGAAADFTIDLRSGRFRGGAGSVRSLPSGIKISMVTTNDERFGQTTGAIRFFADGSSSGGALALEQRSRRQDIRVDWVTGRVVLGPQQ